MSQRPAHIVLPPRTPSNMSVDTASSPLPSPRLAHIAGDRAPAMSPLDAFAAQSRLLAKQLDDESRKLGRPISRLPHTAVADTLAKRPRPYSPRIPEAARPSSRESQNREDQGGSKFDLENPAFRPRSVHPQLSKIVAPPPRQDSFAASPWLVEETTSTSVAYQTSVEEPDYFGAPRSPSPEPIAPARQSIDWTPQSSYARSQSSFDSIGRKNELQRGFSVQSSQSSRSQYSSHQPQSLLPPNPPFARKTPSIRSVDSDDESHGNGPSLPVPVRQLSSGSAKSGQSSPPSPPLHTLRRTPSQASELSLSGPRFAHNFSRPMSRADGPPVPTLSRTTSTESYSRFQREEPLASPLSTISAFEPPTPSSVSFPEHERSVERQRKYTAETDASYIYSVYSLPRGRMVDRNSVHLNTLMSTSNRGDHAGPSPMDSAPVTPVDTSSLPTPPPSVESHKAEPTSPDGAVVKSGSLQPPAPAPPPAMKDLRRQSGTSSMNSSSTVKASQRPVQQTTELSAEDHLAKGIACHEQGSLNESTYHLRISAKQNNPTAMLLYALACRHGWGMRQNPSEAIQWLRKAMDCASIELANDEGAADQARPADFESRKTRKAQFALSVYELGVSHMNGWGIEQDKSLALRCFEIASSWGDADAMAEAGFCYAQGVGCRKDLKKAAKYYRGAEAKGMSMVGNSWIYKSKYAEDDDAEDRKGRGEKKSEKDKKSQDKSRTRSIFARKKSFAH